MLLFFAKKGDGVWALTEMASSTERHLDKNLSYIKQKYNTKYNNKSNYPHNQLELCYYSSPKKASTFGP